MPLVILPAFMCPFCTSCPPRRLYMRILHTEREGTPASAHGNPLGFQLPPEVEKEIPVTAHSSDIVVISSDVPDSLSQEDGLLLRTVGGSHLNFSQVVVTRLGTQEMSLDHIQHLYSYIDTDEPLIVVEIGKQGRGGGRPADISRPPPDTHKQGDIFRGTIHSNEGPSQ